MMTKHSPRRDPKTEKRHQNKAWTLVNRKNNNNNNNVSVFIH